ncbi:MAG: glycosyltransferase [Streptosporangiaceae bacterium]
MRVCLVHRGIHQITCGGICTLYRALAKRLDARGHEVTVITQGTPDPVRAPDAKLIVWRRTDDMSAHRRAVTTALIRIRPDVIDCSTWESETRDYLQIPAAAAGAGRRPRRPVRPHQGAPQRCADAAPASTASALPASPTSPSPRVLARRPHPRTRKRAAPRHRHRSL